MGETNVNREKTTEQLLTELSNLRRKVAELEEVQTAHRRIEDAIRQSEEKYRALVENINDVIFTLDTDGYITYASSVMKRITGYENDDVVGQHWSRFVYPADLPFVTRRFKGVLAGQLAPYEFRIFDQRGEVHYVRTSSRPITDNGQVLRLTTVMTDITAHKRLENQVREYNSNLERLVEERTAELHTAQQQLIHSEKLASLGRMAASVAHEISNPLSAISGYLGVLEENISPDHPDRKVLQAIQEGTAYLFTLLRQLRDFSRPPMQTRVPVAVNTTVERVLRLTNKQLSHSKIEVERKLCSDLPTINASASQLEQVFLNLVINAVDAMPEGGVLTVCTKYRGDQVCVEFKDTGTGIPNEHLDRIFEPYFTTKGENGTGLGLAISHRVLREHNGNIFVESRLDEGSTFVVELPVADGASRCEGANSVSREFFTLPTNSTDAAGGCRRAAQMEQRGVS